MRNIPGGLAQIDSGPKGIVYGVTSGYAIYCRLGITTANPKGSSWRHVPGGLKYVSCGKYGCWGVSIGDHIWFRNGVTPTKCEGVSWKGIPGRLQHVEVCHVQFSNLEIVIVNALIAIFHDY